MIKLVAGCNADDEELKQGVQRCVSIYQENKNEVGQLQMLGFGSWY